MAPTDAPTPSDVPEGRAPALDRLDVLVGSWEMEARFAEGAFGPGSPAIVNRDGHTSFEWLEGRFFLLQRFQNDHPAAPSGLAVIGATDEPDGFVQHYFDSRGVARRYAMRLDERQWTLQGEGGGGGFHQRYLGEIGDDGRRIVGAWESSRDGRDWHRDFELSYDKVDR
jgi:hypothetical protein